MRQLVRDILAPARSTTGALADLERLRERVEAGKADGGALTLAEYPLARASKRLTRAITGHPGGDGAA